MNPIILADSRFLDALPTATGSLAAGSSVLNIRDGRPYTWLQWAAAGTYYVTAGASGYADCLAVIGHNLASAGATISVELSTDGGANWSVRLAPFEPASDRALLVPFTSAYGKYRIKIASPTAAPQIAVAMVGARLEFPFPPDTPYTPYVESVEEETQNSKAGHPLGTVVRYFPAEVKPQFSFVDRGWIEEIYRPFREDYSRYRKYFFWAWDIDAYPEQVFYLKDSGKYDPTVSVLAYYDKLRLEFKGTVEA